MAQTLAQSGPYGDGSGRNQADGNPARGSERRRFARVLSAMSSIVECGDSFSRARIIDLSSNGMQLQLVDELPDNPITSVVIPFINHRAPCRTVWRAGQRVGIQLLEKPFNFASRLPVKIRRHLLVSADADDALELGSEAWSS